MHTALTILPKSQFQEADKVKIQTFSQTFVKGKEERKNYSTAFEEVKFKNFLQP